MSQGKYLQHIANAVPISQLPGVDIEANESAVTLRIPYVSIAAYIEMANALPRSHGRIFVVCMSPLATAAANAQTISGRLWAWHEDVQLYGQTSTAIFTQGPEFITEGPDTLSTSRKKKGRMAPSDMEERPITSFFRNASQAVGALNVIPSISAYTGPTAWALSALSGAASALGWSKPSSALTTTRMYGNPYASSANCNGVEPVHSLALDGDAKLQATDRYSPSGMDEASINFIKRQFSYWGDTIYSTTSPVDSAPIFTLSLEPRNLNLVNLPDVWHTPVSWLASAFEMYRGGFDVKIKIAKTSFHRGKLQVSFAPGIQAPGPLTLRNTAYLYRHEIDLAEGSEFCFTVPYLIPLDYLPTGIPAAHMYIHAITPLQAPSTVSSSVTMAVYVRGAEDLQFQIPILPSTEVYVVEGPEFEVQGPDELINNGQIACATIGGAPTPTLGVEYAANSASELPLSITQLLKRYSHLRLPALAKLVSIYPWTLSARFNGAAPGVAAPGTRYQSYLLAPYAFQRGGVKIKLHFPDGDFAIDPQDKVTRLWAGLLPGLPTSVYAAGVTVPTATTDSQGYLASTEATASSGGLIVQAPYQAVFPMAVVRYYKASTDAPDFASPRARLTTSYASGVGSLERAYADDFQPIFWVGVPRMAFV